MTKTISLCYHRPARHDDETCDDTRLQVIENATLEEAAENLVIYPKRSGRVYVGIGDSTFSMDTDSNLTSYDKDDCQTPEDEETLKELIKLVWAA